MTTSFLFSHSWNNIYSTVTSTCRQQLSGRARRRRQFTHFKISQLKNLFNFLIIIIIINNIIFIQADCSTYCINRSSFLQWNHINRKRIAGMFEGEKPTALVFFHCKKQKMLSLHLKFALNFGFVQTFN